jgi:hypothetical protein
LQVGFLIRVLISMWHRTSLVWRVQSPILAVINYMSVMVRDWLYHILLNLNSILSNALLSYQMFCMYHILKNPYCLFRNFALRIMYFLNFIHLCFMLRI